MNTLSPFLTLDTVRVDLDVISRKRLFEEAALVFEASYGIPHTDAFDALFAREKLGCTCLGRACAIPHGRLETLDKPAACFIRTKNPVEMEAPDGRPAQLFFFFLVPSQTAEQFSSMLQEAKALFSDKDIRQQLLQAPTPIAVCDLIHNWVSPNANASIETENPVPPLSEN